MYVYNYSFLSKYLLAICYENYTTRVNIEVDVLAKMVEKSIAAQVGYVDAIKFECIKDLL
jgi:hypothetical protein